MGSYFNLKWRRKSDDIKVLMRDMKAGQIGIIIDPGDYYGNVVMRTLSAGSSEVMDLSKGEMGDCWTGGTDLRVSLLPSGTEITLVVK